MVLLTTFSFHECEMFVRKEQSNKTYLPSVPGTFSGSTFVPEAAVQLTVLPVDKTRSRFQTLNYY